MSPRDQMAHMFDAIDGDSQRYVLAVLQGEFERAQRTRRPALHLVDSSPRTLSPDEAAMLEAFRSMNGQQHGIVLEFARTYAKQSPSRRPALAIVAQARKAAGGKQ